MAGIAFNIRILLNKKELSSVVAAFVYSSIVSSGPWLFIVITLGVTSSIGKTILSNNEINLFMGIIIYVFAVSMVATYGTQIVVTRYLADCIFKNEDHRIPTLLLSSVTLMIVENLVLFSPWIVFYLDLDPWTRMLSILLLVLVSAMWATMIFVSTIKAFKQVAFAFFIGFGLSTPSSLFIGSYYGLTGFLLGLTGGITIVIFLLTSMILREFKGPVKIELDILYAHKKFPLEFLYGFLTGMGIWVDKIMYWTLHQVPIGGGLVGYPIYDAAMFIGYLTVLPSFAYFILIAETDLYDSIRKYLYFTNEHGTFSDLERMKENVQNCIVLGFKNLGVFQGLLSILFILLAPAIITALDMSEMQISMLRIGILGAFFQMGMMVVIIVLGYFGGAWECFWIALSFFVINLLGTYWTLFDFWLYGYGFFLASFISFVFGCLLLGRRIKWFHYKMICDPQT